MDKEQNDKDVARCCLCGEAMPPGEQMFKFHGYSGDCPAPPLPVVKKPTYEELAQENSKLRDVLLSHSESEIARMEIAAAERQKPSYDDLVNKVADLERMCELHMQTISHNAEFRENEKNHLIQKCDELEVSCSKMHDLAHERGLDNEQLKAKIARMSRDYDKYCDELFQQKELASHQIATLNKAVTDLNALVLQRGEKIAQLESECNALAAQLHDVSPADPISDEDVERLVDVCTDERLTDDEIARLNEQYHKSKTDQSSPVCPWCGAESKWSNGPHQRFICGSGVDAGWVPDRNQSDRCKLNCERQENGKLRAILVAFGKADLALDAHDDGIGCDTLIDDHANAYKAIKDEARRLATEVTQ